MDYAKKVAQYVGTDFTLKELEEFAADENAAGELYKGKYSVCETSGSTVEMLASEQIKGSLHLNLKEIIVGGETVQPKTREYIKSAFHCNMRSLYGSTEASGIAIDCDYELMHLNNKDLIVEPVDENNNPVSVGQKAYKILITALAQRTVPLIRYEISDKITIHNEPCKCGNKAPWVEVEGRTVEPPFTFQNDGGEVVISTFILFVKTMGLGDVRKPQIDSVTNKFKFAYQVG